MNSYELFANDKRIPKLTQEAIAAYLKEAYLLDATLGTIEMVNKDTEESMAFDLWGIIRMCVTRKSSIVPLSFGANTNPEAFFAFLKEILIAQTPEITVAKIQMDFMKKLFSILEPEFKAQMFSADAKSTFFQPAETLGAWSKIKCKDFLKIPMQLKSPNGKEIAFDFIIPLVNHAQRAAMTKEFFGYDEDARILVVDDSSTSRKISRVSLNSVGYNNIDECPDGLTAFNKIVSSHPQFELVVADWHMPNMTGLELLSKIRADQKLKTIPVMLVTGERNPEEVANAIKQGVSSSVVKPFSADTLLKSARKAKDWYLKITGQPKKAA